MLNILKLQHLQFMTDNFWRLKDDFLYDKAIYLFTAV